MAEVSSPVCRLGSKVGSGQPLSPGSRNSPSRSEGPKFDSVPPQSSHGAHPGTANLRCRHRPRP
jgi:hypothetical protein